MLYLEEHQDLILFERVLFRKCVHDGLVLCL